MGSSIITGEDSVPRCAWTGTDLLYREYHDTEWGVPERDDRALFEKVCLEGFQAGLSWITILRKREAFREVFQNFSPEKVANFNTTDINRLLQDERIIRHRGKIEATIGNARVFLTLKQPLNEILWNHAPVEPGPRPEQLSDIPAVTAESTALSKTLRSLGFRFVGPTTMYALMQAMGIVDDHVSGCHRADQ